MKLISRLPIFVADKRAPTPSAAAEIVTPDKTDMLQGLARAHHQFLRLMQNALNAAKQKLNWTQKHLAQLHPKRQLLEKMQRLDFAEHTFVQLIFKKLVHAKNQVNHLSHLLQRHTPIKQIHSSQHQINLHGQQLINLMRSHLAKHQTSLANVAAKLDGLSPLATLQRGFAIAAARDGEVLLNASKVKIGDEVRVRLAEGRWIVKCCGGCDFLCSDCATLTLYCRARKRNVCVTSFLFVLTEKTVANVH